MKHTIKPLLPVTLVELGSRVYLKGQEVRYRKRLEGLGNVAGEAVAAIAALTEAQCFDANFLEHKFIPFLGLNDEKPHEQAPELSDARGKGLHIWHYPSQLAGYLVWVAKHAIGITSYLEIGCRWGGMFILTSEWIRKNGGQLGAVTAVDPIQPSPLITAYFNLLQSQSIADRPPVANYLRDYSTSPAVREAVDRIRPDFVFIDGDHRLRGALSDHMLVRKHARIIAHDDVYSEACPDTIFLWRVLKELEAHEFEFAEFLDQYPSVKGHFGGMGVMKRKSRS